MSTKFFKHFTPIYYKFGDEKTYSVFSNLTQYVDLVDVVKSNDAYFNDYTVLPDERPDQVSLKIYGTTEYYWTFFMLNDHIRSSGWPMAADEVLDYVKSAYPHRVVTTKQDIATQPYGFEVGSIVRGSVSNTVGKIIKRNLELGQLVIDTTNTVDSVQRTNTVHPNPNGVIELTLGDSRETFHSPTLWTLTKDGETINSSIYEVVLNTYSDEATVSNIPYSASAVYELTYWVNIANPLDNNFGSNEQIQYTDVESGIIIYANIHKETAQYNAVHHYEDADGNWVDINPYTQVVPSTLTPITNYDMVVSRNEELRKIKVLKEDVVKTIAREFKELMRNG